MMLFYNFPSYPLQSNFHTSQNNMILKFFILFLKQNLTMIQFSNDESISKLNSLHDLLILKINYQKLDALENRYIVCYLNYLRFIYSINNLLKHCIILLLFHSNISSLHMHYIFYYLYPKNPLISRILSLTTKFQ